MLKKLGKKMLCIVLEAQVKQLRRKNDVTFVVVAGSVGKTSTKMAIAQTLATKQRVMYQDGNYNDRLTVPLVLFGHDAPGLFNIAAWIKILAANQQQLRKPYPYDSAVLEIGADGPGQLIEFAYLEPEITVLTAIAPEHMEYFKTLDAVAAEELTPLLSAKTALISIDDVDAVYLPITPYLSMSAHANADYRIVKRNQQQLAGQDLSIQTPQGTFDTHVDVQGKPAAKAALAATAVADLLKWPLDDIASGLPAIVAVPGRMQILQGLHDSTLIDDTYNASPIAVKAALDTLYHADAPQRIVILGSMNEIGDDTPDAHREVGDYCKSDKLDLVVTIGQPAKEFLAPIAEANGCTVKSFMSPYDAGRYVKKQLKPGSLVLGKGSQNGVFAEEALALLLHDPVDTKRLVRQSSSWQTAKRRQFPQQ